MVETNFQLQYLPAIPLLFRQQTMAKKLKSKDLREWHTHPKMGPKVDEATPFIIFKVFIFNSALLTNLVNIQGTDWPSEQIYPRLGHSWLEDNLPRKVWKGTWEGDQPVQQQQVVWTWRTSRSSCGVYQDRDPRPKGKQRSIHQEDP